MKLTPEEFINLLKPPKPEDSVQFGKVDPAHVSGRPKIVFDGTSTPSVKKYPCLSSYVPAANDRVMLLKGVVIGKIV